MSASPSQRLNSLEGARFMIALTVTFAHGYPLYAPLSPLMREVFQLMLEAAMSWFFVLSGFVIHYNYHDMRARGLTAKQFLLARFARLYPLYFLVVAIPVVRWAIIMYPEKIYSPWSLLSFMTMMQTWWLVRTDGVLFANQFEPISTHLAWSISVEAFFYLVYVLAMWRQREKWVFSSRIIIAVYLLTVLLCVGLHFSSAMQSLFASPYVGGVDVPWMFYYSPYLHVPEFLLGTLAASYYLAAAGQPANKASGNRLTAALWVVYIGIYAALIRWDAVVSWHLQVMSPFVALLIYVIARYPTRLAKMLAAPMMVICAQSTYSLYLVHGDVMRYVESLTDMSKPERIIVTVLLLVFVCSSLYRFYERPARDWIRGLKFSSGHRNT